MSNIPKIILVGLFFFNSFSQAATDIKEIPKSMKFFSEEKKNLLSESSKILLENLAATQKMAFYKSPALLPLDALLTNEKLDKAILVTVNRRVNPEYLNKLYKHSDGQILHAKINDQQLALLFYNFSNKEVQAVYSSFKERFQGAHFSFFMNFAEASEWSEVAKPSSNSNGSATGSETKSTGPKVAETHQYVVGEEFVGCGKGLVKGLNETAMFPWNAGWSAGSSLGLLMDDPPTWWHRSVEEFKALKEVVANFRQYIGDKWSKFLSLPVSEQSKTWCTYVGTPALMGAVTKASMAGNGLTKLANPGAKGSVGAATVNEVPPQIKLDPNGLMKKGSAFGIKEAELQLITPAQLKQLPNGTVLTSINGRKVTVGKDVIDGDTRGGFLAYGFAKTTEAPAAAAAAVVPPAAAVPAAITTPPAGMVFDSRGLVPKGDFFGLPDSNLQLITPAQFDKLPKGTVLTSINGEKAIVGFDKIGQDVRGGFLSYGFRTEAAVRPSSVPLIHNPPPNMVLDSNGLMKKGSALGLSDADLNLITPAQLNQLPQGTVLTSINGKQVVVGVDRIDGDARGGFLAFGFKK